MRRILAAALLSGMLILAGCTTEAPLRHSTAERISRACG